MPTELSYYARNREKRLAYQKARYLVMATALKAYQKAYHALNADTERVKRKVWRNDNREQFNASERRRYVGQAKVLNARNKAWRLANPDKERTRHQEYDKAHPENVRERVNRRKAIKCRTQVEKVDYKQSLRDSKGLCGICQKPLDLFGIDFDHIVPLAMGGTHISENIQATHSYCNRVKGAKVG